MGEGQERMMVLVVGGSGSGKSEFSEEYAGALANGGRKYYIATMQAGDEESRKRVARHRRLRGGKGFITIEQPVSIGDAVKKMEEGERTALLECVSNLTANEMFGERMGGREEADTVEAVVKGIDGLRKELTHLVVVGNNVFQDGKLYDEATMAYIRAMGKIHGKLAAMADEVIEVVAGIPIKVKGMGDSCIF